MTRAQLLSTGQAASLLGVTPDTVLKWIKKGKLSSTRTAGGHFRVPREEILALAGEDRLLKLREIRQGDPSFCWEFHAPEGRVDSACRGCLVYRSHALRCYELIHLSGGLGHAGVFCDGGCDDCSYYQSEFGKQRRVLVVTDSVDLRQRLTAEAASNVFELEFATGEYECSTKVGTFNPEFVVIDCSHESSVYRELSYRVGSDPRIPHARVILAGTPSGAGGGPGDMFARVSKPFSLAQLNELLDAGLKAALEDRCRFDRGGHTTKMPT